MPPCQPISPLGRPFGGGPTVARPAPGTAQPPAAPSPPSRRRRSAGVITSARLSAPSRLPTEAAGRGGTASPAMSGDWRLCQPSLLRDCPGSSWPPPVRHTRAGGPLSFTVLSCRRHQAGCPSGQRERSVKPSASPSQVRILDLPPVKDAAQGHSGAPDLSLPANQATQRRRAGRPLRQTDRSQLAARARACGQRDRSRGLDPDGDARDASVGTR